MWAESYLQSNMNDLEIIDEPFVARVEVTIESIPITEGKISSTYNSISQFRVVLFLQRIGLRPRYSIAALLASIAYITIRVARTQPRLFAHLLTTVIPIYKSLKAIENPAIDDDERWLVYWCSFGVFSVLDHFFDSIKYTAPKHVFLLWMSQNGSPFLYRKLLRHYVV